MFSISKISDNEIERNGDKYNNLFIKVNDFFYHLHFIPYQHKMQALYIILILKRSKNNVLLGKRILDFMRVRWYVIKI